MTQPIRPASRTPAALLLDPVLLAVLLFIYGAARAATLSITHDEALNYFFYLRGSWGSILAHTGRLPSNDHLLNTLAVKALLTFLPPTELVLRLPALVGLALYLGAAARLAARSASVARRALGFLLLAANPFLLDLLVLSRGYALGLGFTLVAWAAILSPAATGAHRRALRAHAAAALAAGAAVLANISFLFSLAALAGAAVALALARCGPRARPAACGGAVLAAGGPFAAVTVALGAIYTPAVVARIRSTLAGFGGVRGVWADTAPSLADGTLYGARWFDPWRAEAVAALTILAAVAVIAAVLRLAVPALRARAERTTLEMLGAALAFAGVWAAEAIVAHELFGMRYPVERVAAVLLPCITLIHIALWELAARSGRGVARHVPAAVGALVLVHFALCANLTHTYLWRYDAATRTAMPAIAAAAAPLAPASLRLGVSWQLEPAVNFYRVTRDLTGLAPVTRHDPRLGFDLYYLTGHDRGIASELGLTVCAEYPAAPALLAAPPGRPCPAGQ